MCIKGGYILQPRIIDDSSIAHESPITRELWAYLLRNVSYQTTDKYVRGSGFFDLGTIAEDLHWYVGYRKMKYSKSQLTKTVRRLTERNTIETAKEIRGFIVTICNYEYYQDPKNYEGNSEGNTKKLRRNSEGLTINKNIKNIKNKEEEEPPIPPKGDVAKTWREDFKVYRDQLDEAYKLLIIDEEFIKTQEKFNPDVDIILSMDKSITNYWGIEAGWKKKKSDKKLENPDWKTTLVNAIGRNRVFKPKYGQTKIETKEKTYKAL